MKHADIKNPRSHRLLCSVTGAPADDAHHINHKGMGGRGPKADADFDDATPLARWLHDAHHNQGEVSFSRSEAGTLYVTAKGKTAKRLRMREGQQHIAAYEGKTYDDPLEAPDDDPAVDKPQQPDIALGDSLHTLEVRIAQSVTLGATEWRIRAEAVCAARDLFMAVHGKAGRLLWVAWREGLTAGKSPIPMSGKDASVMTTVVANLPEGVGCTLQTGKQYEAAMAVKRGKMTAEEAVALADSMSVSDFRAEVYGEKEAAAPTQYACKSCGAVGTKDALLAEV